MDESLKKLLLEQDSHINKLNGEVTDMAIKIAYLEALLSKTSESKKYDESNDQHTLPQDQSSSRNTHSQFTIQLPTKFTSKRRGGTTVVPVVPGREAHSHLNQDSALRLQLNRQNPSKAGSINDPVNHYNTLNK
jgi:hypothetical protein